MSTPHALVLTRAKFYVTATRNRYDLEQILELQRLNTRETLTPAERNAHGFLPFEYNLSELDTMRGNCRHVVAASDGRVVGYALVLLPENRRKFRPLEDLFEALEHHVRRAEANRYFIVAQTCVAREFRGQGVFRALHRALEDQMSADFDMAATEISRDSTRALKAHESVGFRSIGDVGSSGSRIVVWPWR